MRSIGCLSPSRSELNMKAIVRYGACAWLLVAACNAPDNNALFGPDAKQPTPPQTAGTGSGSTTAAGGSSTTAVGSTSSGGTADTEPTAGKSSPNAGSSTTAGTGGTAVDNSDAGQPNMADMPGQAGAPDAVGGTGQQQPPAPVCGNGVVEGDEECDDSGHAGDDGCDANCKVVCSQFGAGTLESEDHHCYRGFDEFDFETSQQDCVKRGAHLATISSEAENKIALTLVNGSKWIGGLEDVALTMPGTGAYAWVTGEPFTFTNWGQGQPDEAESHCGNGPAGHCYEHCVALMGNGTWADNRCDITDGYVCEWEPAGKK